MAKTGQTIFFFALISFLSSVAVPNGAAKPNLFSVDGMVYCDTCRTQFVTRVSKVMEGAKVKLECKNITTETVTFTAEAVTDKLGLYTIEVEGDHENDICEVSLVKSSRRDCCEIGEDKVSKQAAMISLTSNNGETSDVRHVSPLGFLKTVPLPVCPQILKELELNEDDEDASEDGQEEDAKTKAKA